MSVPALAGERLPASLHSMTHRYLTLAPPTLQTVMHGIFFAIAVSPYPVIAT
jgi:hypothetical protein